MERLLTETQQAAGLNPALQEALNPSGDGLLHAYAAAIHKAQGSEYPAAVMPESSK